MEEVQIVALSSSESTPGNYVVILESVNSHKRMAIIIGAFEAQLIAVHLERMELLRPLTHDIFKTVILQLGATLKEVIIYSNTDDVFRAWLVLHTAEKTIIKTDARASDAIALAVRFNCPVMIGSDLLEQASVEEPARISLMKGSLADYSIEELESLLQSVLQKEDYESASRIRDMIKRKNT